MTTIIAGLFDSMPEAELAVRHLREQGRRDDDIAVFHNNPPGQHDRFPIGGDEAADPEARGATKQALAGAAVGAGAGGLAGAVAGPLGAAVGAGTGAWLGALAGALRGLASTEEDTGERRRPGGIIVAVRLDEDGSVAETERILRHDGARFVERADGEWRSGDWQDFDPVASPVTADDDPPEILYRIAPGGRGRWNVFEGGAGKLLSDFGTRDEAVNYASALAAAKRRAVVEIYRAGGELESSRAFSSPRPGGSAAPG